MIHRKYRTYLPLFGRGRCVIEMEERAARTRLTEGYKSGSLDSPDGPLSNRLAPTNRLWQFYGRPIVWTLGALWVYAALLWVAGSAILTLSAGADEAVANIFAVLFGLTLTAFAVLSAVMPVLRRDFVKSETLDSMSRVFTLTMCTQLATVVLAWAGFIFHAISWTPWLGLATVPLGLISLGLTAEVVAYMSWMFAVARKGISES